MSKSKKFKPSKFLKLKLGDNIGSFSDLIIDVKNGAARRTNGRVILEECAAGFPDSPICGNPIPSINECLQYEMECIELQWYTGPGTTNLLPLKSIGNSTQSREVIIEGLNPNIAFDCSLMLRIQKVLEPGLIIFRLYGHKLLIENGDRRVAVMGIRI